MALSAPPVLGITGGGSSAASHAFGSFTPDANTLYIMFVFARVGLAEEPTCSDDVDGAWTAVPGSYIDAGTAVGKAFYKVTSGSPSAIVVTIGSVGASQVSGIAYKWTGASTDFSNVVTGINAAGDPSITMGSFAASSTCIYMYGSNSGGATTPATGYTEISDSNLATNSRVAIGYDTSSPATGIAITGTGTDSFLIGIEVKEASTNKTLAADAAAYTFTGQAASLELGRELPADAASFALTGQAATFVRSHRLIAAAGSFSFNGEAASLELGRKLVAEAAAFAFAGQAADLVYTPAGAIVLSADAVSFAFTGSAAALELGRKVLGAAASYTFTGQAASLVHGWKLAAAAGSFAFNGETASLEIGRKLAAAAASYALTGQAASLEHGREIAAEAAAFTFTGQDATLVHDASSIVLSAEATAFAFTGSAATLIHSGATTRRRTGIRARGLQGNVSRSALQGVVLRSNVQSAGTRRS